MKEKYTKKATARIITEVLKLNPKVSKLTTLDQAYTMLMEAWDIELSIGESNGITNCSLYRDDFIVYNWEFENIFDYKIGDWDWDVIYKKVLEDIIKNKLYKRPKLTKKKQKELDEQRKKQKELDEQPEIIPEKPKETPTPQELRKRRDNLSMKIRNWKKKGKDISELEKELNEIKMMIKNF